MNGNGHDRVTLAHPPMPSWADLSSAQRASSMDALLVKLRDLTAHVNGLTRAVDDLLAARDAQADVIAALQPPASFLARLRLLVLGR